MASKGWSTRFDEPIVLDDGTKLTTLRDAIQYLAKSVPEAERDHEKVLIAQDHLTRSTEQDYPLFFARCGRSTGTMGACSIQIAKTTIGASGN